MKVRSQGWQVMLMVVGWCKEEEDSPLLIYTLGVFHACRQCRAEGPGGTMNGSIWKPCGRRVKYRRAIPKINLCAFPLLQVPVHPSHVRDLINFN